MGVDRTLPREEFFYRQLVSSADSLKAYHARNDSKVYFKLLDRGDMGLAETLQLVQMLLAGAYTPA